MLFGSDVHGVPSIECGECGALAQVLNPTSDTYEFHWMPEETEKRETEDPFRCLTKCQPENTLEKVLTPTASLRHVACEACGFRCETCEARDNPSRQEV